MAIHLTKLTVHLPIPGLGEVLSGELELDEKDRKAAWELYVELVTRIGIAELKPGEGSLREALTSLYSLFATTRGILRQYGPTLAKPKGGNSKLSLGYLAVLMLNSVLRPVLAVWHPELTDYENIKPGGVSSIEHERNWSKADDLRQALNDLRLALVEYANHFGEAAGVPPETRLLMMGRNPADVQAQ